MKTKLKSGKEVVTETMLYALGRSGNTDGVGAGKLGIPIGKYGHIEKVDQLSYQTSIPNIYAAGDVIGASRWPAPSMEQGAAGDVPCVQSEVQNAPCTDTAGGDLHDS